MANDQNLIPAAPGEVRNPNGRPKGSLNLSTIVKRMLDDPALADKVVTKKPGWWDSLPNKNLGEAVAVAMAVAAINGEPRAANWLRKTGWGDKLIVDGELRHEGVIIYKPEKYPRLGDSMKPIEGEVVESKPVPDQPVQPLPAPNPDLDGIA